MRTHARRWMILVTLGLALAALPALTSLAQTAPANPPAIGPAPAENPAAAPAAPAAPANPAPATTPAPGNTQNPGNTGNDRPSPFGQWQWLLLIAAFVLMFLVLGRRPRKEEKRRKEMLANIKKGDKVTTIGGEMGTVVDVRDDEVVIKVDEGNNTRMRFARWAIRNVGEETVPEEKK